MLPNEDFLKALRQTQTLVHDQISAIREEASTSLQLAAEAETKATAAATANVKANEALDLVRRLAERVAVLEGERWKTLVLFALSQFFACYVGVLALEGESALRENNLELLKHLSESVDKDSSNWMTFASEIWKATNPDVALQALSRASSVLEQLVERTS